MVRMQKICLTRPQAGICPAFIGVFTNQAEGTGAVASNCQLLCFEFLSGGFLHDSVFEGPSFKDEDDHFMVS
jgi:hypothetical protein